MFHLRVVLKASAALAAFAAVYCFASTGALAYPHLTTESAAPIYMSCPEFTKGAESPKGPGWIELNSFQLGHENSTTIGSATGGAGAGKIRFSEFKITRTIDKASPIFFDTLIKKNTESKNDTFKHDNCTVNLDKQHTSETQPYLTITLENVMVSSFSVSSGGDRPTESISFNFTKIEFKDKASTGGQTTSGGNVFAPGGIKPTPSPSPRAKPQ